DGRADIYALGATLYHALTGRLPFTGSTARELLLRHTQETPVEPHVLVPGLSPAVSEVVRTMMEKNPDDRYQNCAEVVGALHDVLAALAQEASAAPPTTHRAALSSRTPQTTEHRSAPLAVPTPTRAPEVDHDRARYSLEAGSEAL